MLSTRMFSCTAWCQSGFKSGGFNGANSNTTQQLTPYDEEKLTSYELGNEGDPARWSDAAQCRHVLL